MDGIDKITSRINADVDQEIAEIQAQAAAEGGSDRRGVRSAVHPGDGGDPLPGPQDGGRAGGAAGQCGTAGGPQAGSWRPSRRSWKRPSDKALEDLLSLPEQEYVELLAKLITKASQSGSEQVIFSQKDRPRYGKAGGHPRQRDCWVSGDA